MMIPLVYSLSIFGVALIGGIIPILIPGIREDKLKLFVSLGAGLLLGMAFLHMIPESVEHIPHSFGLWLLVGFLCLLVIERFAMVHACEEHGCDYHTIGIAALLGLTIHGIIEGFALASSLMSGIAPLVLIAILSHKAPAAFALTSILKLAGRTQTQIVAFTVAVALSVPMGMLAAYTVLESGTVPGFAGILLAMSSGTFIYIGACDLLPELHRTNEDKFKRLGAFSVGLLISYLAGLVV
ncbi:MAG: ZIP family metal transporter [Deltaproteobacteria bacterium]|nr:ZIP family metal transporter [Deltaproteobacteria bacterium]